jgi:hypothetical protein
VKVDLNRLGPPTQDVQGIDFDVAKIALKFHPVSGDSDLSKCDHDAEVFGAESQVRLQFGNTDARIRIAEHDMDREVNVAEVWILVKQGTARVETKKGSSPLVLLRCTEDDGGSFEVVRAIASGQIPTAHDQTTVALVDIHATDVDVHSVTCVPGDPNNNPSCNEPDNRSSAAGMDATFAASTAPPTPPPAGRLGFSLRDLIVRAATE